MSVPRRKPPSNQYRESVAGRRRNVRQHIDRRTGNAARGAGAVIRDNDALHAVAGGALGVFRRQHALDDHGDTRAVRDAIDGVPIHAGRSERPTIGRARIVHGDAHCLDAGAHGTVDCGTGR